MKSAPAGREVLPWAQGLPQHGLGARPASVFSCFQISPGARARGVQAAEFQGTLPGAPRDMGGLGDEGYKQQILWNMNLSLP